MVISTIITDDGHRVQSRAEALIDNWLYHHRIIHAYEKPITYEGGNYLLCDWYLPVEDIYIEYWGRTDKYYTSRRENKTKIYHQLNLNLLSLEKSTVNNLNKHLSFLLNQPLIPSEYTYMSLEELLFYKASKPKPMLDIYTQGTVYQEPIIDKTSNDHEFVFLRIQEDQQATALQVWGNNKNTMIAKGLTSGDEIIINQPILTQRNYLSADLWVSEELSGLAKAVSG